MGFGGFWFLFVKDKLFQLASNYLTAAALLTGILAKPRNILNYNEVYEQQPVTETWT